MSSSGLFLLWGLIESRSRTHAHVSRANRPHTIAQFLVTARDKYGATVEYFSFNEPDYGVNF